MGFSTSTRYFAHPLLFPSSSGPTCLEWLFLQNFMTPLDPLKGYYGHCWPSHPARQCFELSLSFCICMCSSSSLESTSLLECARARPVPRATSEQEADCVYHGTDQEDPAPMAASRQLGRTFTHEDQFSKAEGLGVPATPPQFSCP